MFSGANSLLYKLELVSTQFVLACVELLPLAAFPFAWTLLAYIVFFAVQKSNGRGASFAPFFEVGFFSVLGSCAAFINYLSKGSLLENLMPNLIVGGVFLFQTLGLASRSSRTPFSARKVLVVGIGAALSFLVSSRYITLIFTPTIGS